MTFLPSCPVVLVLQGLLALVFLAMDNHPNNWQKFHLRRRFRRRKHLHGVESAAKPDLPNDKAVSILRMEGWKLYNHRDNLKMFHLLHMYYCHIWHGRMV